MPTSPVARSRVQSRSGGGSPPTIDTIWDVHDPVLVQKHVAYASSIGNVPVHGSGKNPGNQQRRFHGTRLACSFNGTVCSDSSCAICSIMRNGFDLGRAGQAAGTRFGAGAYSSSTSSKAHSYTKANGGNVRAMQCPQPTQRSE